MILAPAPHLASVPEQDPFLRLFPHRYDYIWAEHPDPEVCPSWQTESRYPLSDRLIQQGTHLYGVRFGKQTNYLMLDIDKGSLYHPYRDRLAIPRLLAALEPLGLVATVAVTSSYRGGLHLYLPFPEPQESWAIAQVVSTLLERAGFKLANGQLEVFPHPRPYSETPSLYVAHRLPLQAGSYLLNRDWQPIYGEQATFVQHWHFAQHQNAINVRLLQSILKQTNRQRYRLSGKAAKFLNDLNTEIDAGWTAAGQTNELLGRIALREYIFGHLQRGTAPLTGRVLVAAICEVARSLPGFETYCGHQANLEQRALSYARSVEASRYYPFASQQQQTQPPSDAVAPVPLSWNQQQAQAACDRIQHAVSALQQQQALPAQVTARRQAIRAYGIGNQTLDKYKELWHPDYLKPLPKEAYHPMQATFAHAKVLEPLQGEAYHPVETNKFVPHAAAPQGQAVGSSEVGGSGGFSTDPRVETVHQQSVRTAQHLAKMQDWLESGDPILMVEAQRFFSARLQHKRLSLMRTEQVEAQPRSAFLLKFIQRRFLLTLLRQRRLNQRSAYPL